MAEMDDQHDHEPEVPRVLSDAGDCLVCKLVTDTTRIAEARATQRAGWQFGTWQRVRHIDGCECAQADAWTTDEVDPRCTELDAETVALLHDGEYVVWGIELERVAVAARVVNEVDFPYGAPAVLLVADEDVEPVAGSWWEGKFVALGGEA